MFPSSVTGTFFIESGLIFSEVAIKALVGDQNETVSERKSFCNSHSWTMPKYSGKLLLKCALNKNFHIWDPIDEVSKYFTLFLFINKLN